MVFNSWDFIRFFFVVTASYFLLPQKLRLVLLFLASCYFYVAFVPQYILILFVLIFVDYTSGRLMEKFEKKKKLLLLISIFANIGILFFFKYFNFFTANVVSFGHFFHFNYPIGILQIILPIGLSFHTFQSLSYIIEVYKGRQKAEKNLLIYGLYVMFYPQLVAGPIERPQHMLPQFHTKHNFDIENIKEGGRRILVGLFKKMILADHLGILVNQVYGSPHNYIGLPLVIATVAFAFQIYCDFSGYSDIAIGTAQVMGFTLMENFDKPYGAVSISDFWRRWHISLYSWFRDYIYIPLGGSRKGTARQMLNTLIVFTISGLWHGASWLFILWGSLHGIYMVVSTRFSNTFIKSKRKFLNWLLKQLQILFTFSLVCVAWVFFRASTLSDALYILKNSLKGIGTFFHSILTFNSLAIHNYLLRQGHGLGPSREDLVVIMFSLFILFFVEYFQKNNSLQKAPFYIRWEIYIVIILLIINFGIVERIPFIYFQF